MKIKWDNVYLVQLLIKWPCVTKKNAANFEFFFLRVIPKFWFILTSPGRVTVIIHTFLLIPIGPGGILLKFSIILTVLGGILLNFKILSLLLAEFLLNLYLYSRVLAVVLHFLLYSLVLVEFCSNFQLYWLFLEELNSNFHYIQCSCQICIYVH